MMKLLLDYGAYRDVTTSNGTSIRQYIEWFTPENMRAEVLDVLDNYVPQPRGAVSSDAG